MGQRQRGCPDQQNRKVQTSICASWSQPSLAAWLILDQRISAQRFIGQSRGQVPAKQGRPNRDRYQIAHHRLCFASFLLELMLPVLGSWRTFDPPLQIGRDPAAVKVARLRDDAHIADPSLVDKSGIKGHMAS
jgi:hypothetical protein